MAGQSEGPLSFPSSLVKPSLDVMMVHTNHFASRGRPRANAGTQQMYTVEADYAIATCT